MFQYVYILETSVRCRLYYFFNLIIKSFFRRFLSFYLATKRKKPPTKERKTRRATNLPAVKKQYLFSKPEQTRTKFLNFLIK